jgi:4-hydroxybenzoate polyprenyltransferase
MFLTIGFIVGFAAGWYINDKVDNLADKLNPYNWFKKK